MWKNVRIWKYKTYKRYSTPHLNPNLLYKGYGSHNAVSLTVCVYHNHLRGLTNKINLSTRIVFCCCLSRFYMVMDYVVTCFITIVICFWDLLIRAFLKLEKHKLWIFLFLTGSRIFYFGVLLGFGKITLALSVGATTHSLFRISYIKLCLQNM